MLRLLLLALLLRLPLLNQSLWLDEAIEALALRGHFGSLWSYALSDFQPPLYHYLLSAWTSLAGYSELALRTPSLLAGVALVYFVVKLATLLASDRTGLIAGLLAATNPLLIYYSQEGRTYILTALLVTMSFYYLFRMLSKSNDVRANNHSPLLYLFASILALWSSYLAWFVIILQLVYLLSRKRFYLARLSFLSLLTLTPWLPSLFRSLSIGLSDASASPAWGAVVGGISIKALALTWIKLVVGRISFSPPWLYVGLVSAVGILHLYIFRNLRPLTIDHRPLFIWLASIALSALISLFVPAYSYTRVLFVVPAYLILLAFGLDKLPRIFTYSVLVLNLVFLSVFWFTPRFHREDWRGLVNYLNAQTGVVALPSLKQNAPLIYYGLTLPLSGSTDPGLSGSKIYYLRYAEDIFDLPRAGRANLTESGYTLTKERSFIGIPLEIYEK